MNPMLKFDKINTLNYHKMASHTTLNLDQLFCSSSDILSKVVFIKFFNKMGWKP